MYNSQMNPTNFGFVVVDQAHTLDGIWSLDPDFFFEFALHPALVNFVARRFCIDRRDMTSYANAHLAFQSRLTRSSTTRVTENRWFTGIVKMAKNTVGNQLFERWILFHFAARAILNQVAAQQLLDVDVSIARKTLEISQRVKKLSRNYEDLFSFYHRHL
jgi:hypothetical protein